MRNIKGSIWAVLLTLGLVGVVLNAATSLAADDIGRGAGPSSQAALPSGHTARYRVTYMKSNTTSAIRTSTVVSITNHSSLSCSTSVDWRVGFGGAACTTTVTLGPGQTGDHCSRSIPSGITSCNATCSPSLTFHEGSAIVGSSSFSNCEKIAVSARTYYTTGSTDGTVAAATDAKLVKIGFGNSGD
jgi:hypothetical protein